jgi:RNA polymerase sigma factor (sigma-70 family)
MIPMFDSPLRTSVARLRRWAAGSDAADSALLAAFATERNEDAFAALVARHGPLVYGVSRRILRDAHLAEDAFQAAFLLLAQKAADLTRHPCLGAWLHSTAYRIACKIRSRQRRWAARQDLTAVSPEVAPIDPAASEFQAVFDEELAQLPAGLRRPLVLCYLQGATQDDAARKLGLPLGTLRHRLQSARQQMRCRLLRRGVEFAVAGAVMSLTDTTAPAAVVARTLRSAFEFANGGNLPHSLIPLLKGVTPMSLRPWQWVAIFASIVGGLVAGGGLLRPNAAPPPAAKPQSALRDRFNDPLPEDAVARIGTSAFRDNGWIRSVSFSPDGTRILTVGQKQIRVWETATGREVGEFQNPAAIGTIIAGAFSADGKSVFLVADSKLVHVFDLASATELRSFTWGGDGWEGGSPQAAFFADAKILAASQGTGLRLWDLATGRALHPIAVEGQLITQFRFADGAGSLVTLDAGRTVRVWDAATGKETARFAGPAGDLALFAVSPDGRRIATVGRTAKKREEGFTEFIYDGVAAIWNITDGKEERRIDIGKAKIASLAFSPDSQSLVLGQWGPECGVQIWDVVTGRRTLDLDRQSNAVQNLAFSQYGRKLATESHGLIRIWDPATGKEAPRFDAHNGSVNQLLVSTNGTQLMTASSDGTIRTWDILTGKPVQNTTDGPHGVGDLARSPDGSRLAAVEFSHTKPIVRIRDGKTGGLLRELAPHPGAVDRVVFSPDGSLLAVGNYKDCVQLWDPERGTVVRTLAAKEPWIVGDLAFSADGKRLFASSIDGPVYVWDVATGAILHTWSPFAVGAMAKVPAAGEFDERAMGLAFSPDRKQVALGVQGKSRIVICDTETGKILRTIDGLNDTAVSIAFSPDGKTLASGTWEGPLHLWNLETGAEIKEYRGHRGRVLALTFTPDGKYLISGSEDTTALVWKVK